MSMRIMYEIPNSNTGCSHGAIIIDETQYFFKRLNKTAQTREMNGYTRIIPYYPTASSKGLYFDGKDDLVLYEFIHDARVEGGMLSDILDDSYRGDISHAPIIEMFRAAYSGTLQEATCDAHDVFFTDRVDERLKKFYNKDFIEKWSNCTINVNGKEHAISFDNILSQLQAFFSIKAEELSVISQGDPTEYNISTKPLLLDYDAGGRIPIMAELAVMNATTAYFGDYMARKYNPGYYQRRGLVKIVEPIVMNGVITREINDRRKKYLLDFADMVDSVIGEDITQDQAHAYACYFAMKILAVFNISKFQDHEVAYLLSVVDGVFRCAHKKDTTSARRLTEGSFI